MSNQAQRAQGGSSSSSSSSNQEPTRTTPQRSAQIQQTRQSGEAQLNNLVKNNILNNFKKSSKLDMNKHA